MRMILNFKLYLFSIVMRYFIHLIREKLPYFGVIGLLFLFRERQEERDNANRVCIDL